MIIWNKCDSKMELSNEILSETGNGFQNKGTVLKVLSRINHIIPDFSRIDT